MKTELQIKEVLSNVDTDKNKYHGMTYEQGVEEALLWVLDELEDDEFPYSEKQY